MSRFAINPKWLIYLPPTMSPSETIQRADLLEHPAEAFGYFRKEHVEEVVCEQKHMGSRAVVIVCRDRDTALRRFGVIQDEIGGCYTRTGRRFFNDGVLEKEFLCRVQSAVTKSGLWDELASDWLCLDCELMAWASKAQDLLRQQYAPTGAAARAGLAASIAALRTTTKHVPETSELAGRYEERLVMAEQYVEAYRHYCWAVHSLADLKLAPFHLLASEGVVHADKDHVAYDDLGPPLRRRCWTTSRNAVQGCQPERRRESGGRHCMVGRSHRLGRRGHGGKAASVCGEEPTWCGATGSQMPRAGVPAHHLWAGVQCTGASRTPSCQRSRHQAIISSARVRVGCGSPPPIRRAV